MTAEPGDYDLEPWLQAFDEQHPTLKRLREEVQYALEAAVDEAGIKVHSIVSRVKHRDSFCEKIGRKQYADPMSDMRDLVGARVVCLFLDDVAKIDAAIRKTFGVLHYDDKGKDSPPEMWRYLSVHYDCAIKDVHQGPRYDDIKNRAFEVQVRTILQDAWATIEHYLAYKGASSIPAALKRDFSALVGLFHVADKSFQQIYDESIALDEQASQEVSVVTKAPAFDDEQSEKTSIEINRSTLKALSRQFYPQRKDSSDFAYSELVEDLAKLGVTSVDELQGLLVKGLSEAELREGTYLREHKGFTPLSDVDLCRLTLSMQIPEYKEILRGRLHGDAKRPKGVEPARTGSENRD